MFNIPQPQGRNGRKRRRAGNSAGLSSAQLGARTRRGKASLARSGVMPSGVGFGPYGHDYDSELRCLVPNAVEAENVLRAMLAVVNEGATPRGLVRQFNDEGIPAKLGGKWTFRSMVSMLTNPVAKGEFYWGKTARDRGPDGLSEKRVAVAGEEWVLILGCAQAIVPADLFDLVQDILAERRRAKECERRAARRRRAA